MFTVATTTENEAMDSDNKLTLFRNLGIALSGAIVTLTLLLIMVLSLICCRRKKKSRPIILDEYAFFMTLCHSKNNFEYVHCYTCRQEIDFELDDCSTNTIPNEYRQHHQESGNCSQQLLQIAQYEHMQGSSSLSWVRANFVRQLTEAFIIPLKSIELTRQIGEGMHAHNIIAKV